MFFFVTMRVLVIIFTIVSVYMLMAMLFFLAMCVHFHLTLLCCPCRVLMSM